MDQGPLVIEEIDAGAELTREFDRHQPIKAAFWLKVSDEEQRYLYLASHDGANVMDLNAAYREVLRLAGTIRSPYLDPFRIKVISGDNPLTLAAVEVNRRFPGPMTRRLGSQLFGGVFVDDGYIYPSPLPVNVG